MAKVTMTTAEREAVEVDLWGTTFTAVPITRTRSRAIRDCERRMVDVDTTADDSDDQVVRIIGEMLDCALAPEAGKRRKPSAIIWEKWQADELEMSRLMAFVSEVTDAASDPN